MADGIFNKFKEWMGDNTIDMDGDTFKCALFSDTSALPALTIQSYNVGSSASVNLTHASSTHTEVSSGSGYTTGGVTMSTTWVESAGTVTFDASPNSIWSSATFTARYAVLYSNTDANKGLVALIDFGASKAVTAGTFTIQWHASGIFTLS